MHTNTEKRKQYKQEKGGGGAQNNPAGKIGLRQRMRASHIAKRLARHVHFHFRLRSTERPEQKNDIVNAPIWGDGSRVEKGERIAPADTNMSLALLMMMSAIQKKVSQKSCFSGHRRPCQKAPPPSPHLQVPYNVWSPVQPAPPPGEHREECATEVNRFPSFP